MNRVIVELTLRQLLSKRRTLLLLLAALVPVLIALAYRLTADTDFTISGQNDLHSAHQEWAAETLLANLVIGTLLPLAALVFGTAALGSEIEDGTAVYLLSKPISRWKVLLSKLFVAWLITAAFITVVTMASGAIAIVGQPTEVSFASGVVSVGNGYGIIFGFAAATVAGSLVYAALFVALSIATSRAFISGLIYVFLWEGIVTRLFRGTRILSVRQYTLSLAERLSGAAPEVFRADLGFAAAVIMIVVVTVLASWLAVRRLQQFEIGEAT
jgi:ABC-2 type transport system permease protein